MCKFYTTSSSIDHLIFIKVIILHIPERTVFYMNFKWPEPDFQGVGGGLFIKVWLVG